jgi:phytoene dehydrogenase-like protein
MSAHEPAASSFGALVIGGGISGLVAAAYLARGGVRVCLLEAQTVLGGESQTVDIGDGFRAPFAQDSSFALDRATVRGLALHKHGLRYAERDMPLVALRHGGRHVVVPREFFAAQVAIVTQMPEDAIGWSEYRRDIFRLARRLRPLWNGAVQPREANIEAVAKSLRLSSADAEKLDMFTRSSAAAYLDRWFQTDALKIALMLDATIGGISPYEAGSALALLWRYAQESCGLQAASSQVDGGPGSLTAAFAAAARSAGAELRLGARAVGILADRGRVQGVKLENGETLRAPIVLSSLSEDATMNGLLPAAALPLNAGPVSRPAAVASAKVLLALSAPPPFAGLEGRALHGRLVVAERPESAADSKGAALRGEIARDPLLEASVPSAADASLAHSGTHVLSVWFPFVPVTPEGGWPAHADDLRSIAIDALAAYAPGLKDRIVQCRVVTPDEYAMQGGGVVSAPAPARILASFESRIVTRIVGLYLCGADAEPMPVPSGRAARLAAEIALRAKPRAETEMESAVALATEANTAEPGPELLESSDAEAAP